MVDEKGDKVVLGAPLQGRAGAASQSNPQAVSSIATIPSAGRLIHELEDYPMAVPDGVEPIIFKAQLLQTLRTTFQRIVKDLSDAEALDAAVATWETEWCDHPEPRTLEDAQNAAWEEVQHWEGE